MSATDRPSKYAALITARCSTDSAPSASAISQRSRTTLVGVAYAGVQRLLGGPFMPGCRAAPTVDDQVPRGGEQPGPRRPVIAYAEPGILPGLEQHLLDDVLRHLVVVGQPHGEPPQLGRVPIVQFLQRGFPRSAGHRLSFLPGPTARATRLHGCRRGGGGRSSLTPVRSRTAGRTGLSFPQPVAYDVGTRRHLPGWSNRGARNEDVINGAWLGCPLV